MKRGRIHVGHGPWIIHWNERKADFHGVQPYELIAANLSVLRASAVKRLSALGYPQR